MANLRDLFSVDAVVILKKKKRKKSEPGGIFHLNKTKNKNKNKNKHLLLSDLDKSLVEYCSLGSLDLVMDH